MDAQAVVVEGSRCAVHPERAGTACARCGTFRCDECLVTSEGARVCRECLARAQAALPSLPRRARWARGALLVSGVTGVLTAFSTLPEGAALTPPNLALAGLLLAGGLAQLLAPVLFLRWFHLAARHALVRGYPLHTTAWGAVGSWFIPFVNLTRPFELTRAMCPDTGVGLWQALFLTGNVATAVTQRLWPAWLVPAALVSLGAALAGGQVVKDVTARLTAPLLD